MTVAPTANDDGDDVPKLERDQSHKFTGSRGANKKKRLKPSLKSKSNYHKIVSSHPNYNCTSTAISSYHSRGRQPEHAQPCLSVHRRSGAGPG
ncbi:hypothetical protein TcWFU_009555 [Taenia crassiceps]|uniref:Uncharacterized protein n=1 Tax=Taenia crassiceps TaxID=6207 RepID=A0ABR4Q2A6_9CEST